MRNEWRKSTYKIISTLLTVGVFYFAFIYGKTLLANADFSELDGKRWLLLGAFFLFGLSYLVSSWHWLRVCKMVNTTVSTKQMLSFFASQPYKYLPSSIFSFSYRAKFAKQLGLSLKESSLAQLIENIDLVGASIVTSALFYVFYISPGYGVAVMTLCIAAALLIANRNIVIKIPKTNRKIYVKDIVPNFGLMTVSWIIAGCAFLTISYAFNVPVNPMLMISANAAAQAISIMAVFAPGGVGVRELTLALFSINNSVIVTWRLVTFTADMILGFGAVVAIKLVSHRSSLRP